MENKGYEKMVLNKIESSINIVLPIAAMVCFLGAYAVFLLGSNNLFIYYNLVSGFVLFGLFFGHDIVSVRFKIVILVMIALIQGFSSLFFDGFTNSGIASLAISLVLVVGFFSVKTGLIFSGALLAAYTLFPILIEFGYLRYDGIKNLILNNPLEWALHAIVLLMLEVVIIVVFSAIKKYLIDSVMDVDTHLEKIYNLAYFDQLTKLPNRNRFIENMDEIKPTKGFIVLLNIRGLNLINSIYGTKVGDRVIRHVANALEREKQNSELVAKIAGNELIWFSSSGHAEDLILRLGKLADKINHETDEVDIPTKIHFNAGFVALEGEYSGVIEMLQKAAMALEQAKVHTKFSIMNYDYELEEKFRSEEKIKNYLGQAIEQDEFYMSYQEKRDCTDNKVVGVEALARWDSSVLGTIPPSVFIPLIDKANLSVVFGNMIVRKVLEEYKGLTELYKREISVSINISPTHIASPEFSEFVIHEVRERSIKPENITFEITEDSLIENLDNTAEVLLELRKVGFKISLDDFGTGYSSLSYLSKLGFDELKIDKSFIQQLNDDQKTGTLIRTIINLKDTYGINIVAEGVETKLQSDMLHNFGCDVHQGYLFSKPKPLIERK